MASVPLKEQKKGGCQCCSYVLGGDTAHPVLHCGYEYFQQAAKNRKVMKLCSFPAVEADQCCDNWCSKNAR
jgi:hypothetical protein